MAQGAGVQVVIKDLNDFSSSMQNLVKRITTDFQNSKPAGWRQSVTNTAGNGQVQFGQVMDEFQSAGTLQTDYGVAATDVFFNSDLQKFINALTVLGEAAAKIATNYQGASNVDTQGAQAVDNALNNAQAAQTTSWT